MTDDELHRVSVGGPRLHDGPIHLAEPDSRWPQLFDEQAWKTWYANQNTPKYLNLRRND